VKDQIFHPEHYPTETVNYYSYTLYQVALEIVKMYAPFIPFVTETIYQAVFATIEKSLSIHQATFKKNELQTFKFNDETEEFQILLDTLNAVRKLKSEHSLSLKTECEQLILYVKNTKLLEKDRTAVALLLGATKCKTLVLETKSSFENSLIRTETGFIAKVNLIREEDANTTT
jgi:valyl-tRNA synthetase